MLCGQNRTVPTRYKLEGGVREGDYSQRISRVIEIWKGRYKDGMVALKVLNVSLQDPHILTFKRVSMPHGSPVEGSHCRSHVRQRFCEEVVFMEQLEHHHIVPFYGISTTIASFCLVFPWYRNGNITEYVKQKPGVNRFDLVSMLGQPHTSDAYLLSRTVIWCGQRTEIYPRQCHLSRRLETSTRSSILIDEI